MLASVIIHWDGGEGVRGIVRGVSEDAMMITGACSVNCGYETCGLLLRYT